MSIPVNPLVFTEQNWLIPKFFKLGLNLVSGPSGSGKTSLCIRLARSNHSGHLWVRGPQGDGRQSVFVPGGLFQPENLSAKAGNSEEAVLLSQFPILEPKVVEGKEYPRQFKPTLDYLKDLALNHNPAMIFFDFLTLFAQRGRELASQASLFCDSLPEDNTTAFVGLINGPWPKNLKGRVPILQTKLRHGRVYIHNVGFAGGTGKSFLFNLETQLIEFKKAWDSPHPSPSEKNRALFIKTLNRLVAKDPNGLTNSLVKKQAHKVGVSHYFLQRVKWQDYGFKIKSRGFGPDYQKYLVKR